MAKKIVPSDFKTHLIEQLIESVDEPANTVYYAFIGDHVNEGDTQEEVSEPTPRLQDLNVETYRNMILGKRLNSDDFSVMVERYDWEPDTVYDQYDDLDINLADKQFYVAVDETAFIHVYKCLSNANGNPSTTQPTFNDVRFDEDLFEPGDNYYQTADGYQWKYMYSVNSQTFDKFATQKYMPIVANNAVEDNAQNGSIDVIQVDEHGKFYNNTISSNFNESTITGNPLIYGMPQGSSVIENFYANTILHLIEGKGAGQYKRVTRSFANNFGTFVEINDNFEINPDITTRFEISPEVRVTGDGTQTIDVVARAIVNATASNSVHRVEVLEPGLNYNFATAEVLVGTQGPNSGGSAGEIAEVESANVRPIIPPPGGHGANSAVELGGRTLAIHAEFNESEGNTIPAENTFGQFGIVRDPLFSNVEITIVKQSDGLSGSDGQFVSDEPVFQFKKKRLFGEFTVTANSANVISTDDLYLQDELSVGDFVYLTNDTNATFNYFTTVENVINNNAIQLANTPNWTASNTTLYYATPSANAVINQVLTNDNLFLRECDNKFVSNRLIVGSLSQAVANVQTINVNNRLPVGGVYDFNAFNQTTVIDGSISNASALIKDELLFQEISGASGFVHSVSGNRVFVTRVTGEFDTGEPIIADTSGVTIASNFAKYNGELDPTSGNINYLQNDIPVTREGNRSEEIRVILEF
jgi:hypothetical protein